MTRDELARRVRALLRTAGEPEDAMEVTLRPTDASGWVAGVTRPDAATHMLDACAMGTTEGDACEGAWRQIARRINAEEKSRRALLGIAEQSVVRHRLEVHRIEDMQFILDRVRMTDDAEYLRLLHAVNAARRALEDARIFGDAHAVDEAAQDVRVAEEALAWCQHQHGEEA